MYAKHLLTPCNSEHTRLPKIATAGQDGRVKIWNSATLQHERTILNGSSWVTDLVLAVSVRGEMLITSSIDRVISVFDASTGDLSRTFRGKKAPAQGHPLRRRCTRSSFWLPAHRQK
ncbi:hypothetical protein DIPPA_16831 [Diplonema papillatum]|nr:hypothetical protein DIPPA_16831 [Diplonema papillatum]